MLAASVKMPIAFPVHSGSRSRAGSESNLVQPQPRPSDKRSSNDASASITGQDDQCDMGAVRRDRSGSSAIEAPTSEYNEKTPLLEQPPAAPYEEANPRRRWLFPKRVSAGVMSAVADFDAIAKEESRQPCFADVQIAWQHWKREAEEQGLNIRNNSRDKEDIKTLPVYCIYIDGNDIRLGERTAAHARRTSNASSGGDEIAPAKRSIRIKLHNEDALRQRKAAKKAQVTKSNSGHVSPEEAAAALKSPTGPVTAASKQMTKFPRAPQPPRPLVPRRQPSYSGQGTSAVGPHQKTLIIDLDETLIHSMSKGGRFQTGRMVEVKLQASVGAGGQIIGPQVPILYYVHKRPYCDDFLKKVSKWYNLVIFTASVQEYADPVIDWLEVERKYFVGRYYRQHCTFRNGAYIKDLAQVEPDLSKVMILDNSPLSYIFHPDNAIPIEGWISDPTDYELLHLIPLLEGLQYVADVRALLALRLGMPPS
ncbi:hypothetical protein SNOG_04951 [Parastagonospora nodorum SN15]|uniref:FCP1 homology domain-containing protein n=1 Tax=Phaeosphaeria nodorum (strain SN15 / ATCC MYA-4574 / FGSC 10173) TaxID=321614 RepID=Q0UTG3_PHANO|nr:hypothetical protein SNOG_04951 [Parastagonospora nodorum SN15]EAT87342.2 hypothetical protein SNOG_04951 [Parastagonospora nodorum SN15]